MSWHNAVSTANTNKVWKRKGIVMYKTCPDLRSLQLRYNLHEVNERRAEFYHKLRPNCTAGSIHGYHRVLVWFSLYCDRQLEVLDHGILCKGCTTCIVSTLWIKMLSKSTKLRKGEVLNLWNTKAQCCSHQCLHVHLTALYSTYSTVQYLQELLRKYTVAVLISCNDDLDIRLTFVSRLYIKTSFMYQEGHAVEQLHSSCWCQCWLVTLITTLLCP